MRERGATNEASERSVKQVHRGEERVVCHNSSMDAFVDALAMTMMLAMMRYIT